MSCVPITAAKGGLLQSPAPCCWQEEKEGSEAVGEAEQGQAAKPPERVQSPHNASAPPFLKPRAVPSAGHPCQPQTHPPVIIRSETLTAKREVELHA